MQRVRVSEEEYPNFLMRFSLASSRDGSRLFATASNHKNVHTLYWKGKTFQHLRRPEEPCVTAVVNQTRRHRVKTS